MEAEASRSAPYIMAADRKQIVRAGATGGLYS